MRSIGNVQKDAQVRAVASGALSNGDTVIVNSDGTVSAVSGSTVSESAGTDTAFATGITANYLSAVYLPNVDRVMVVVQNYVYIGDISGSSITFQSPAATFESTANFVNTAYDPTSGQVLILWNNSSSAFQARLATVPATGNSVTFGSIVTVDSDRLEESAIAYDTVNDKFVVVYTDWTNLDRYGTALVGTVSGTSISFGTPVVFRSARTDAAFACVYDVASGKIVVGYNEVGTTGNIAAIVGTVSGTSISFGSSVTVSTGGGQTVGVYDSNSEKTVFVYSNSSGRARVGTVSGTSISFGTEATFGTSVAYPTAVYDTAAQKLVVSYLENFATTEMQSATVSGTDITFDSPFEVSNSVYTTQLSSAYDPDTGKVILVYKDVGSSNEGWYVVYQAGYTSTNLTSDNFIGFADSGYANGQSAAIDSTCSINTEQTGLTAGQKYYVQTDGSLGLTAADPSVEAGTAISATEILVKG